jgi:hypothetical protein
LIIQPNNSKQNPTRRSQKAYADTQGMATNIPISDNAANTVATIIVIRFGAFINFLFFIINITYGKGNNYFFYNKIFFKIS